MSEHQCAWFECDEVFEDYVRDALGPDDRDAFEAHYFACAACADKLQTYGAVSAELAALPAEVPASIPARRWRRWWVLVPLAGSLAVAASVGWWLRSAQPARPESTVAGTTAARAAADQAPSGPPGSAPAQLAALPHDAAPLAAPAVAPAVPAVAMSVLVHVDPPLYVPVALRGQRDEAAEQFEAAMRLYRAGDHAGALAGLRAVDEMDPDRPRTRFFLSVCQLLLGQNSAAAAGFERTIALGESPYLEESHFYLAKAWLRLGRLPAARRELHRTVARHGGLEQEARQMIAHIDALAAGKDRPPDK
jgi:hypothetical protein